MPSKDFDYGKGVAARGFFSYLQYKILLLLKGE